ncbi:MAG: hypothetical protein BYD32DRAFT_448802 [Podila humilis]|nr:MAG: hypothetical protein BYD32DRAFT_448802 [Podila humilis]
MKKHSTRQQLKSEYGLPLASQATYTFGSSKTGYILWSDIRSAFGGSSHLEKDGRRAFLEVDADYKVREPPRILYTRQAYVVMPQKSLLAKNNIDIEGYKQLHRILEKSKSFDRRHFLIILGNLEYQRAMLMSQIKDLPRSSAVEVNDISTWRHMLSQLDNSIRELDNFNIWSRVMTTDYQYLEFAGPRLFLVLPKDLSQWNDRDPTTHQFRLFFLCDFDYHVGFPTVDSNQPSQKVPRHVHVCDHPGYDLDRPSEFFQQFGQISLAMLELIKFGFSGNHLFVPPLTSFSILQCCEGVRARHSLTDTNIGALVDKSISYLFPKVFLPTGKLTRISLSASETWCVRSFLRSSHMDNGLGGLLRTVINKKSRWLCHGHSFYPLVTKDLLDFGTQYRTRLHKQLGSLNIVLTSASESRAFCARLQGIQYLYELSISLHWNATLTELQDCLGGIGGRCGVKVLHIDGINRVQGGIPTPDALFDYIDNSSINLITVAHYPMPFLSSVFMETVRNNKCILMSSLQHTVPGTRSIDVPHEPTRPHINWMDLFSAMGQFVGGLIDMSLDNKPHKGMSGLLADLSRRLIPHRVLSIQEIQLFDQEKYQWQGTFAVKDGTVQGQVHAKLVSTLPRESLVHGALQQLDVPTPFLGYMADVHYIMVYSPQLQNLTLPAQDNTVLAQILFLSQSYGFTASSGLMVTLFQSSFRKQKVIAKVNIQRWYPEANAFIPSQGSRTPDTDSSFATVDPQLWEHDYISEKLMDSSANVLEAVSRIFPYGLKSFDLDISNLTQEDIGCVKNALLQSALEQLHIRCVAFNPTLEQAVLHLLKAVPWPTIKSLVLSGDKIDTWIQLWANGGALLSVRDGCPPQLMRLIIQGTGVAGQSLSHAIALAIHGLVYVSPLLELQLKNIRFQEERDWRLIIGAINLPLLDPFYRPRSHIQHVKVSVPEQLISTTVEDDLMLSASKGVQLKRINRSRQIAVIGVRQ